LRRLFQFPEWFNFSLDKPVTGGQVLGIVFNGDVVALLLPRSKANFRRLAYCCCPRLLTAPGSSWGLVPGPVLHHSRSHGRHKP
jgi:hypothetical protein